MSVDERAPLAGLDDRAARVVRRARDHAEAWRSPVIGPEHLLLALLPAGAAEVVRADLVPGPQPSPPHLPFSAEAGAATVRAADEARRLGDDRIGRDHLLLGVLRAGDDPAVRRLAAAGVDYASAYAEIVRRRAG